MYACMCRHWFQECGCQQVSIDACEDICTRKLVQVSLGICIDMCINMCIDTSTDEFYLAPIRRLCAPAHIYAKLQSYDKCTVCSYGAFLLSHRLELIDHRILATMSANISIHHITHTCLHRAPSGPSRAWHWRPSWKWKVAANTYNSIACMKVRTRAWKHA